jgi:hypothetical protein
MAQSTSCNHLLCSNRVLPLRYLYFSSNGLDIRKSRSGLSVVPIANDWSFKPDLGRVFVARHPMASIGIENRTCCCSAGLCRTRRRWEPCLKGRNCSHWWRLNVNLNSGIRIRVISDVDIELSHPL